MAWCGRDITFVRVGPALEHLDAKGPRLLCFGQLSPGYDTEVPESVKKKRFVCTPEAMGRPVLIPRSSHAPLGMRGLGFSQDVVQVAFGCEHWALLTAGTALFTAGENSFGQLGRGSCRMPANGRTMPLAVVFWSGVQSVACGSHHTLVVYHSQLYGARQVWGCGWNVSHQLSVSADDVKTVFFPLDISKLTGTRDGVIPAGSVARIAAGASFSVFSVDDMLGIIGEGAPRQPGRPVVAGLRIAEGSAWRGLPIKHLVAGCQHILFACVDQKRLRVWGWGPNTCRQLGFPDASSLFDEPAEIVYDCPQQASDTFSSMLAAAAKSSVIMVNGEVWGMGGHESDIFEPTDEEPHFYFSSVMHVRKIEQAHFENKPIAYVGTGPRHAAFVTTCGQLFVRGYCSFGSAKLKPRPRNNSLPTAFRRTKRSVVGVCKQYSIAHPLLVPRELLHNEECGVVRQSLARKLAFLMGTHARLRVLGEGRGVSPYMATLDTYVLKLILDTSDELLPALVRA